MSTWLLTYRKKACFGDSRVTNISKSFTHKTAAKTIRNEITSRSRYVYVKRVDGSLLHISASGSEHPQYSRPSQRWANLTEHVATLLWRMTRSSAVAEGPRDASCQLKSCQLPRNSAETTCTTSPESSVSCRKLTRATKSCCRQRLTICAINYSGRASELGGIIDLVDRRQPSVSRSERPPFSS